MSKKIPRKTIIEIKITVGENQRGAFLGDLLRKNFINPCECHSIDYCVVKVNGVKATKPSDGCTRLLPGETIEVIGESK